MLVGSSCSGKDTAIFYNSQKKPTIFQKKVKELLVFSF